MNNILKTIYCDECKKDIPVEELDDGSIVIHCPKCIGECMLCDCHLAKECFPEAPSVRVQHPGNGKKEML
ncbi:MAG: hypothetical protein ACE5NG_07405 [bacterium]